jgi:hypothetical protein
MFADVPNDKLKQYLKKNVNYPTVILCALIMIEKYLELNQITSFTKNEIEAEFNNRRRIFGINTFRRDYLKRQSGDTRNLIDEDGSQKFFLRKEFLSGVSKNFLKKILIDIQDFYKAKNEKVINLIDQIQELIQKENIDNQCELIKKLLNDDSSDFKRGQVFEITSYAILKTHFQSFGFCLNRFSVTVANDGGMDFIGQNAVYQATVVMNQKKFEEDIEKLPSSPRVIVYKKISKEFDISQFDHPDILRTITYDDLIKILDENHINFAHLLKNILLVISSEFQRELILT